MIAPGQQVRWVSAVDDEDHALHGHVGLVVAVEIHDREDDPVCTVLWNRPAPWPLVRGDHTGTLRDGPGMQTFGRWFQHDLLALEPS